MSESAALVAPTCPRCRVPGEDGDRFCAVCGGSLVPAGGCAGCGHTPPPGANFCPACGTPVASPGITPADAAAAPLGSYGSFGRRVAASLIDLVCVLIVWVAAAFVWALVVAAAEGGLRNNPGSGWGGLLMFVLAIATAALYIWSESWAVATCGCWPSASGSRSTMR